MCLTTKAENTERIYVFERKDHFHNENMQQDLNK